MATTVWRPAAFCWPAFLTQIHRRACTPQVQLAELDVSDVVVPAAANGSRKAGAASLLKRPPGSQPAGMSGQPGASAFARRAARSAEDAEAEYARARERIMGVALPGEASDVSVGPSSSAGSYGAASTHAVLLACH